MKIILMWNEDCHFFFIVAPCILVFTQFIHRQMHIY